MNRTAIRELLLRPAIRTLKPLEVDLNGKAAKLQFRSLTRAEWSEAATAAEGLEQLRNVRGGAFLPVSVMAVALVDSEDGRQVFQLEDVSTLLDLPLNSWLPRTCEAALVFVKDCAEKHPKPVRLEESGNREVWSLSATVTVELRLPTWEQYQEALGADAGLSGQAGNTATGLRFLRYAAFVPGTGETVFEDEDESFLQHAALGSPLDRLCMASLQFLKRVADGDVV